MHGDRRRPAPVRVLHRGIDHDPVGVIRRPSASSAPDTAVDTAEQSAPGRPASARAAAHDHTAPRWARPLEVIDAEARRHVGALGTLAIMLAAAWVVTVLLFVT